jgi:hypothetical protein
MQASSEVDLPAIVQPTIVAVGFTRAAALSRLLESINNSDLPSATRLLISLDGGASQDTVQTASDFAFAHGEKEVKLHVDNLGLREHILWVGDQTRKYGSIIVLEDDILVDRYFYRYAVSAICKYESDANIAGVALYSPKTNEYVNLPFEPLVNNSSSYFMQVPCSWGQAWTQSQWAKFRDWYDQFANMSELENIEIPRVVKAWPESSWKKYFAAYLADQDKYFSYPYRSYATNCSDAGGTHVMQSHSFYQVPLADQARELESIQHDDFSVAGINYDAYMEPSPIRLSTVLGVPVDELVIDSYGSKPKKLLQTGKFSLTTKRCSDYIRAFNVTLRPVEQNLLLAKPDPAQQSAGTDSSPVLFLAESQNVLENKTQFMRLSQYFSYQRMDTIEFGLPYVLMYARKLIGRLRGKR